MGSNYGWSLVQCVADLASLPAFGDRYRVLATELGFEGHMAMAEAMP